MMAIVGAVLSWLLGFLFKRPSSEAKAAAAAAKAETSLAVEVSTNEKVADAVEARRASDAAILLDPERLRDDDGFRRD